jgi:hypothetical protein
MRLAPGAHPAKVVTAKNRRYSSIWPVKSGALCRLGFRPALPAIVFAFGRHNRLERVGANDHFRLGQAQVLRAPQACLPGHIFWSRATASPSLAVELREDQSRLVQRGLLRGGVAPFGRRRWLLAARLVGEIAPRVGQIKELKLRLCVTRLCSLSFGFFGAMLIFHGPVHHPTTHVGAVRVLKAIERGRAGRPGPQGRKAT